VYRLLRTELVLGFEVMFYIMLYTVYVLIVQTLIIVLDQVLTAKSSSITDKDYITRIIFKNIY